jgi:alpha-D-xyloside xylohydrolase
MKHSVLCSSLALSCAFVSTAFAQEFKQTENGIVLHPKTGAASEVIVTVFNDKIIKVSATKEAGQSVKPSLMVNAQPSPVKFNLSSNAEFITLKTKEVGAIINRVNGEVKFTDAAGKILLKEEGASKITPVSIKGETKTQDDKYFAIEQEFNRNSTESFYGLGQRQDAVVDFNGQDALLAQHNMNIAVPFVVSSNDYGVLWDSNSITRWGDPKPYEWLGRDFKIESAKGKAGVLTAKYYVDGKLVLTRDESKIDYQTIPDIKAHWPKEVDYKANVKVVWEGKITPQVDGAHKFQLYSSGYAKISLDGKTYRDLWRQNWNPWYHNFDATLTKGKPVALKIEWIPEQGYITVLHNNPMARADRHAMYWSSEASEAKRYYFIKGDNSDDVIKGYRQLTGKSTLMPKWSYGFWQSRQRYKTQDELVDVVKEYRKRKIPLDNIVLDWNYWPDDAWGSHDFDLTRFPNAKKMVDDVHNMNANIMISVWGKFYPTTENYKELDAKGYIYRRNVESGDVDWVGPGYLNSHYDPYSQEARDIYWQQISKKLKVLGFDAWWADNTEPDVHSNLPLDELKLRIGPTSFGPGEAVFNPYSLMTTQAFYDGETKDDPGKRPFILTRSGFGGLQRNASAIWSGDVVSRWDNLYNQIAAGVGATYSGIPNWTHDIGGFANEKRYNGATMKPEDLKEWRELNLRWFQFGAFSPLFRSHGEFPYREVYNLAPDNSEIQNNLIWFINLRYRLMPYIYSYGAQTYYDDGSIMRGLAMDFGNDVKTRKINDQYLFGHEIMVAPIYNYGDRSRKVYLPKGTSWYDFNTGTKYAGGQEISINAPLTQIPLFVKSGAIIPSTEVMQYSDEKKDAPITLLIAKGANGSFELYDDDGRSTQYKGGEYSNIKITYDDNAGILKIGARQGSYKNMPQSIKVRIKFIGADSNLQKNIDKYDYEVTYDGTEKTIKVK